jgi:ribonuclease P protein component
MRSRLTLPKSKRLIRSEDFQRVRERGKAQRGSLLMLGVLADAGGQLRCGFVTSRRVGSAVVRNRVRRRLRDIVRRHQREIINAPWVVTIARQASARATYSALEHEWLRLAKRASILPP